MGTTSVTLSHEIGHILTQRGHVPTGSTQTNLMIPYDGTIDENKLAFDYYKMLEDGLTDQSFEGLLEYASTDERFAFWVW